MADETPQSKRVDLEKHLKDIDVNCELYEAALDRMNGMLYTRYHSLIIKGFSKEQAFEIVKHRGLL